MIAKKDGLHLAYILLEELGRKKAVDLLERIQNEVTGNQSFRNTLAHVKKLLKESRA